MNHTFTSVTVGHTLVLYRGLVSVTLVHSACSPVYPSSYAIGFLTTMHSHPPASFATRPHVLVLLWFSKLRAGREAHAS
ncbi:unnamed protein product [Cercopithifilaria johnstoni]|uniref:Secreted protein n=1 Tax=Cercopithifilaria johnstoni TaxID=2874296 RepID=A0A8J2MBX8_9BILA|nr:unnamed protein product [Cercopithifilaria johnstoni]